jgi:hypothetical protein
MYQCICKLEMSHCVSIHIITEIFRLSLESNTDARMLKLHRCHAAEAESVESEFLEPESDIGRKQS